MASHYHEPPVDLPSPHDSSDDDDDDDDHAAILDLHAAVIASNSYDAHVNYINALRKATELDKLCLARELIDAGYPLTPNMWLDWCEDELCLATSYDAVPAVEALFERGVQEYLSVPLWLHYLEFVEERNTEVAECTEAGIAKVKALFERALTSTGLPFTEGGKVCEAYPAV